MSAGNESRVSEDAPDNLLRGAPGATGRPAPDTSLRVALFTDTYLPTINGVARTLGRLVQHLADRGHEVALISPHLEDEAAPGTVIHHTVPGIPLPVYPELKILRFVDRAGRKRLADFEPHLVHVATEAPLGYSGRAWALANGVPLVTSFHTDFPTYVSQYLGGWIHEPTWRFLRWFHQPAEVTFCPSKATLRDLRERSFHDRLQIWSRGVQHELFTPERRRDQVRAELAPGAERILMYVGRIAPEKKLDVLIRAFSRIRSRAPRRTALVFVGDGPIRGDLERSAPGEDVHFVGYRTGDALANAYAAGDIFVFPSDTETFGNVVLEALSSGVPVIAPNKGGVTDMVRPGETGVLVPPMDPEAFARATLELLHDEAERTRLARGAREAALEQSWPRILDGILSQYARIAGRNGDPAAPSRSHPLDHLMQRRILS